MQAPFFASILVSLILLSGCGKWAKAHKQEVIAVDTPRFPNISDNVFALTGGKKSVNYKSTMLILNPSGDVPLLAQLLEKSEMTRIRAAEARAFVGNEKIFDNRYGTTGLIAQELKKKIEDLNAFLIAAQARAIPLPLIARQKIASEWMSKKISSLDLSATDIQAFDKNWGEYCDAKIVELAVQPIFAKLSRDGYAERPSPMQFCEEYYQKQSYFQSESCKQGDYFQCIWTDGVLKSGTKLGSEGQNLRTLLGTILTNPIQSEIFRKILLADLDASSPYINISLLSANSQAKAKAALYEKKYYLTTWMLNGSGAFGNDATCKKIMDPNFVFICGLFAQSWQESTAQTYLSAVEFKSSLIVNKDFSELQLINNIVKYFGQRPLVGSPQNSNSDFLFHFIKTADKLIQPQAENLDLSQEAITTINNTFLDTLFTLNADDKIGKTERESELKLLQRDLELHQTERERLTNVASQALDEGIRAANAGNIGFGFIAYRMIVTNDANIMRAKLTFEGFPKIFFEGCYDKEKLAAIDCPMEARESDTLIHHAQLNLNPSKGRIEFSFDIDQPETFGLGIKPKNEVLPDYFMNLNPADIQGANLRFELYPNRMNDALDILTGKALWNRDGQDIYEAGVSMWEE